MTEVVSGLEQLRCSRGKAWFRGHEDAAYLLKPSLLRGVHAEQTALPEARARLDEIKGTSPWPNELVEDHRQAKRRLTMLFHNGASPGEMEGTRELISEIEDRQQQLKRGKDERVTKAEGDVHRLELWNRGEYEAFGSWRHKLPDAEAGSSWAVLAEMQHFGVPTRLLDWSESLPVAIYFVTSSGADDAERDIAEVLRDGFRWTADTGPASLWILNPFALSRNASSHRRIWDVAADPSLDYCRRFLIDADWPYQLPLPIYTSHPFRRMEAQRGCFTVWGSDRRSLDEMQGRQCLHEVRFTPAARAVARWMVTNLLGYDRFALFLDRDSLGQKLSGYVR